MSVLHGKNTTSKRVQELLGPQALEDTSTLVAELCRVVGVLAEGVLVTEGKRPPRPDTSVRLAHDIADVLYMLIEISNHYHIDLEQAWNDTIQEGWANLAKLEKK